MIDPIVWILYFRAMHLGLVWKLELGLQLYFFASKEICTFLKLCSYFIFEEKSTTLWPPPTKTPAAHGIELELG